jgi:hypothetical protein
MEASATVSASVDDRADEDAICEVSRAFSRSLTTFARSAAMRSAADAMAPSYGAARATRRGRLWGFRDPGMRIA